MWYVAGRNLEEIQRVRVKGIDLVIWKGSTWAAFDDRCAHRGARLSQGSIKEKHLVCPYHGWEYSDDGSVVFVPAHTMKGPGKARKYEVMSQYDLLWVKLDDLSGEIPKFQEYGDPSFMKVHCGPYLFNASPFKVVENFLDVSHFPFVHEGLLGDKNNPSIPHYNVESEGDIIVAKDIRVFQPNPDGSGNGGWENYTYKILSPYSAYFIKEGDGERKFSIFMTVTPMEEKKTMMWMIIASNYPGDPNEMRKFQDTLAEQDRAIVEGLVDGPETYVSSDATVVAYRKLLKKAGLMDF
ncbi:aromatic ring-hydroxylating oxygenase subunit alpha [Sulfuracidifex tepidarius]|uniref:3-phenylpropionate/cinnamic acid dioxygenase subunit alpha n=1 Tax=Sulfuracidifex tepidarius TaxID=1294262 RepID=A0A510DVS9_9CREN|nr:aromatic ring-hydroxylating dioxygenase subunit alpha [Sulfuracidifex tepidarius]BBG24284.1 3-phenylpropionate/cinnamic acid dioxygenase subunit alpha [Sulfuracidifex tepidarius]BBG27041.1 3-phenylpropionate/cinnamic acid dioxygenase subunit alpha [Sulfuracidifex tepidarius]